MRQDWGVFGGRAKRIPDTRSVPKFFFDTQPNPIQFTFEYHWVLHYISGIPDIFGKPDISGNPKHWVHPNTTVGIFSCKTPYSFGSLPPTKR